MAKAKKPKKKRAEKYDPKLKIDGSFEEVLRLSAQPMQNKEKPKKTNKK